MCDRPLDELVLHAPLGQVAAWLTAAETTRLQRIELVGEGWNSRIECERDAAGKLSRITVHGCNSEFDREKLEAVANELARLPVDHLTNLAIQTHTKVWRLPLRRAMARLLDRHATLGTPYLRGFTRPAR